MEIKQKGVSGDLTYTVLYNGNTNKISPGPKKEGLYFFMSVQYYYYSTVQYVTAQHIYKIM